MNSLPRASSVITFPQSGIPRDDRKAQPSHDTDESTDQSFQVWFGAICWISYKCTDWGGRISSTSCSVIISESPCDVIIGILTLTQRRAGTDYCMMSLKLHFNVDAEKLNYECVHENGLTSQDHFKAAESEDNADEENEDDLVFMLRYEVLWIEETDEEELLDEKLLHLVRNRAGKVRTVISKYHKVIASSFEKFGNSLFKSNIALNWPPITLSIRSQVKCL